MSRHNQTSHQHKHMGQSVSSRPSRELDHQQSAQLINRLPQFELSYETISHKKIPQNYTVCLAIPQSKKYYAYFSFQRGQDVCYLMELTREKKIGTITVAQTLFHPSLSLGTLLYGSLLPSTTANSNKYHFLVEDMFYYKGISLRNSTFSHKLGFIYEFMQKSIVQRFDSASTNSASIDSASTNSASIDSASIDNKYNIMFVLPVMWAINDDPDQDHDQDLHDYESIPYDYESIPPDMISKISYSTHHLQYRSLTTICPFLNVFSNKKPGLGKDTGLTLPIQIDTLPDNTFIEIDTTKKYIPDFNRPQYGQKTIFRVCADLQYDIYHLYAYGKGCEVLYYDYAYIPNYRVSAFMNGLFRNIKENRNLDFIEESDDEADFQDMRIDKYVDLAKILFIECVFHKKFKRWTPVRSVDVRDAKVVHISKLVRNYIY